MIKIMYGFRSYLKLYGGENKGIGLQVSDVFGLGIEGYELLNCNYCFYQEITSKGKANSETRGGEIKIMIDTLPSKELIDWGLDRDKWWDGEIGLCPLDKDAGIVEKLIFEKAYCTSFNILYKEDETSFVKTMLEITAKVMKLGHSKIEKYWTESD
jgi:hypothetical protein